jgi:hypothetical protein
MAKKLADKIGLIVALCMFAVLIIISTWTPDLEEGPEEETAAVNESEQRGVVSDSFSDFGEVFCNNEETEARKDALFNEKFKDRYVTWTGEVASVKKYNGLYQLRVKHCAFSEIGDVDIKMRPDQEEKLLNLDNGDTVTYTAKLTSNEGLFVKLLAIDGEIVS